MSLKSVDFTAWSSCKLDFLENRLAVLCASLDYPRYSGLNEYIQVGSAQRRL